LGDKLLAERAWTELLGDRLKSPETIAPVPIITLPYHQEEWKAMSTNEAAQWSLSLIQCLHFVGNKLD
jgi:hypothetical protein